MYETIFLKIKILQSTNLFRANRIANSHFIYLISILTVRSTLHVLPKKIHVT